VGWTPGLPETGVDELKAVGVRVKSFSRVDANDSLVIHLAGAYGMQPAEIAEVMEVPRSTLRSYLTNWNGWTFTSDELLKVLRFKDSELDAACHNICSLQEVRQRGGAGSGSRRSASG
jgi:hypothetical protein